MEAFDARGLQSMYFGSETVPELRTGEAWKNVLQYLESNQPFEIFDPERKETLSLSLWSAPRDQAFAIEPGEFLVGVTMLSRRGDRYDIDFMVEESSPDPWRITRIQVRSVNGRARYQWCTTQGQLRQCPIT